METNNKLFATLFTLFFISGNLFSQNPAFELLKKRDSEESRLYTLNQQEETDLLIKNSILKKVETNTQPTIEEYKQYISVLAPKPVAPSIKIDTTKSINIKNGLCLRGKQAQFADDLSFILLNKNGQNLFVDYGTDIAERNNITLAPNAYALSVNTRGISIIGYDENGTRRGIQELKKLLSSSIVKGSDFPYVRIASN